MEEYAPAYTLPFFTQKIVFRAGHLPTTSNSLAQGSERKRVVECEMDEVPTLGNGRLVVCPAALERAAIDDLRFNVVVMAWRGA